MFLSTCIASLPQLSSPVSMDTPSHLFIHLLHIYWLRMIKPPPLPLRNWWSYGKVDVLRNHKYAMWSSGETYKGHQESEGKNSELCLEQWERLYCRRIFELRCQSETYSRVPGGRNSMCAREWLTEQLEAAFRYMYGYGSRGGGRRGWMERVVGSWQ